MCSLKEQGNHTEIIFIYSKGLRISSFKSISLEKEKKKKKGKSKLANLFHLHRGYEQQENKLFLFSSIIFLLLFCFVI